MKIMKALKLKSTVIIENTANQTGNGALMISFTSDPGNKNPPNKIIKLLKPFNNNINNILPPSFKF